MEFLTYDVLRIERIYLTDTNLYDYYFRHFLLNLKLIVNFCRVNKLLVSYLYLVNDLPRTRSTQFAIILHVKKSFAIMCGMFFVHYSAFKS